MYELKIIALFCAIDDFCRAFEPEWERMLVSKHTRSNRWWTTRKPSMFLSEMMTIAILFHGSGYRTFKHYYEHFVQIQLKKFFPSMVPYKRFNRLMKRLVFPLYVFQITLQGKSEGIAFIDSTVLSVCHICRASQHKVFKNLAKKGKTTTGWFYGLKLHIVVNAAGEIVAWMVTPGNVDDRKVVPDIASGLFGKLFGHRGYVSKKLFRTLYDQGLRLITRLKAKNGLMDAVNKTLLRKRSIVESVINKLKSVCQIEHHRHRSVINFMTNLLAGIAAYGIDPKKPKLSGVSEMRASNVRSENPNKLLRICFG